MNQKFVFASLIFLGGALMGGCHPGGSNSSGSISWNDDTGDHNNPLTHHDISIDNPDNLQNKNPHGVC